MTEIAEGRKSPVTRLVDDFRSLNTKQIVAIAIALAAAILLEVFGMATLCIGFLIIAVVLYMIPHLMGVTSVGVKAVLGVAFVVISVLIGSFAYGSAMGQLSDTIDQDINTIYDIDYVDDESAPDFGTLYFTVKDVPEGGKVQVKTSPVASFVFGQPMVDPTQERTLDVSLADNDDGTSRASVYLGLPQGGFTHSEITILKADGGESSKMGFIIDTGLSKADYDSMSFQGAAYTTAYSAVLFFMILIFSAVLRRTAEKTRTKMEAEGRLYPQGYGRCKECGAMVLPGEVTCRKCGAYIDVPDELKAKKKDFFECSECGAEVPGDANVCPKCGARFDSVENEVQHQDGTVDVSEETVLCPKCGAEVPSNVDFCPKCGNRFDKD